MKLKRWMGTVGGLALICWLATPAIRLWLQPALRMHPHSIQSDDPNEQFFVINNVKGKVAFKSLSISHPSDYWACYRALLLGRPMPEGVPCPEWDDYRAVVETERLNGPSLAKDLR